MAGRASRTLIVVILPFAALTPSVQAGEIRVHPETVVLDRPEASQQLLITELLSDGRTRDATRTATIEFDPPGVVRLDGFSRGLLRPVTDGKTVARIRLAANEVRVPVEVRGLHSPHPVSFSHEILPIITKSRCNSGGCHGKAEGQNGFKLSVFGFDPESDWRALTIDGRGRRVNFGAPERSLLLRKGTAEVPHGGGLKIERDSDRHRLVQRWIAEGARMTAEGECRTERIEIEPRQCMMQAGDSQQLQITAVQADGSRRCVTLETEFESNAATVADVDDKGLVQAAEVPGEAVILARYLGRIAVCRVTLPRPRQSFSRPSEYNFIDRFVLDKLDRLAIPPSDLADDATFLRRAYLDVIGTLPTADESRRFLAATNTDKRQQLVDELLRRPEYVDYWTMRWSDLLRVDQAAVSPPGAVAMTRWLRRQFAENRPYDAWVKDLLLSEGSTQGDSPAAFYKALDTPEKASRAVSQLFLGVRIECAQCHHHPSEKWGQVDYFALAGFFSGVSRKPLAAGGEAVVPRGGENLKHRRTGEAIAARALGAPPVDFTNIRDRREPLAEWMTLPYPENPYFTRTIVNRLWAHYFGRGLVEPIDDLRDTNPASNEPLLDALCVHLRDVKYDLKEFTRTLLRSRTYQISSRANDSNADDRRNYSHALDKPLPAEVLLDMFSQALGVPEKFNGWPLGYRSVQLWDSRVPSYFFRVFGRPVRASVCECERSNEPSIAQALHLLNSPEITDKLQHRRGTARRLADSGLTNSQLVEELYLGTLSRLPREDERRWMLETFAASSRREEVVEDILWSLLNQKEFLYNH